MATSRPVERGSASLERLSGSSERPVVDAPLKKELVSRGYSVPMNVQRATQVTANVVETSSGILNRRVRTRVLPVQLRFASLRAEKVTDRV